MKRTVGWRAVTAAVLVSGAACAVHAAEATLDVSLWSKYLWRGQVYTDDPVLQPSIDVATDFGLGLNAWMNLDLTDANSTPDNDTKGRPTEIDFAVYYGLPIEGVLQAEVGATAYVISEPADASGTTADGYLKLWLDPAAAGDSWLAALPSPSVAAYYDFLDVEDFYFVAGLEKSVDLAESLSLTVGATLGYGLKDYNRFYFDPGDPAPGDPALERVDEDAFNDLNVSVELAWKVSEKVSLSLLGQYTSLIEDPVKTAAKEAYGDSEWFLGGAKVSWAF